MTTGGDFGYFAAIIAHTLQVTLEVHIWGAPMR